MAPSEEKLEAPLAGSKSGTEQSPATFSIPPKSVRSAVQILSDGDGSASSKAGSSSAGSEPKQKPGNRPPTPTLTHHPKSKHRNGGSHSKGGKLLKHQLCLRPNVVVSPDGSTSTKGYTIDTVAEELSFDKGFFLFVRALQLLTKRMKNRTIVVGLAGPSGAGKTVFSEKVKALIPDCELISMDMYNDASRLVDGNFDDPRLSDIELLQENIEGIKRGKAVQVPIYDFKTSTRTGYRVVRPPESRVVIIEGIYALSSPLRDKMDLRVSITGGVHFDLVKRVLRDIQRSGQQPADIIQQVSETVYPMYKAFIEPDLKSAQIRIYNDFNPFSGFQNPIYTLKSGASATEELVQELYPDVYTNREVIHYNDIYLLPPSEDPETCGSWLRMRNIEGKYKLMFEEWVKEGEFVISPGISFEVSVRILGGLLALGYSIYLIMKRKSVVVGNSNIQVKWDEIEGLGSNFVQIQGKNREEVVEVGEALGLQESYIPYPYIEQVQLQNLTHEMRSKTESMLRGQFYLPGLDDLDLSPSPRTGRASFDFAAVAPFDLAAGMPGQGDEADEVTEGAPIVVAGDAGKVHKSSSSGSLSNLSVLTAGREEELAAKQREQSSQVELLRQQVRDLTQQLSQLQSHGGSQDNLASLAAASPAQSQLSTPQPLGTPASPDLSVALAALLQSQQQSASRVDDLRSTVKWAVLAGAVAAAALAAATLARRD